MMMRTYPSLAPTKLTNDPKRALTDARIARPEEFDTMMKFVAKYSALGVHDLYLFMQYVDDTAFMERVLLYARPRKIRVLPRGEIAFRRACTLYHHLRKAGITLCPGPSILDIGTENSATLDAIQQVYKTGRVRGINIRREFADNRVATYDGINVPFSVDVILLDSVLHHVHPNRVAAFIASCASRAKYVIVKDHNITDRHHRTIFMFQHFIYRAVVNDKQCTPDPAFPYTEAKITGHFEDAGMRQVHLEVAPNGPVFYSIYTSIAEGSE
jgi:hypothetical protein